jgi:hypothetical protein
LGFREATPFAEEEVMLPIHVTRRFLTGQLVITPNAMRCLSRGDLLAALRRHTRGDAGDFAGDETPPRPRVRLEGCRRLSAYRAHDGTRFLIITEADQRLTTVLLPEDC